MGGVKDEGEGPKRGSCDGLSVGLLSWRRVGCPVVQSHLVSRPVRLSVQDGAESSESSVGSDMDPVDRRVS